MSYAGEFTVRQAAWPRDAGALRQVREAVFVREQKVPLALERDAEDHRCLHVIAEIDGEPVGTGRMQPDGHIGRMAVLPAQRGRGIGSAMLNLLIDLGEAGGLDTFALNAQLHAVPFYQRFGFAVEGESFMDAGIVHCRMIRIRSPR